MKFKAFKPVINYSIDLENYPKNSIDDPVTLEKKIMRKHGKAMKKQDRRWPVLLKSMRNGEVGPFPFSSSIYKAEFGNQSSLFSS